MMPKSGHFLYHPPALIRDIRGKLYDQYCRAPTPYTEIKDEAVSSAVLLPIGTGKNLKDPFLILNKRSRQVMQPGDLCFPGGRISNRLDGLINRFLRLPGTPLTRWHYWKEIRERFPRRSLNLAFALATAMRESVEEMRLNPFGIRFLGPLPEQRLVMFKRKIFPMVAWVHQNTFFPNWEIERILKIPLFNLLNPVHYAAYKLYMKADAEGRQLNLIDTFPCYIHRYGGEKEILWGVTYRITAEFLKIAFGYRPPPVNELPVVRGILSDVYVNSDQQKHTNQTT